MIELHSDLRSKVSFLESPQKVQVLSCLFDAVSRFQGRSEKMWTPRTLKLERHAPTQTAVWLLNDIP